MLQVEEIDDMLDLLEMRQLRAAHRRQEQHLGQQMLPAAPGMTAEQPDVKNGGMLEQLDVLEGARDGEAGDPVRRQRGDIVDVENQTALGERKNTHLKTRH